MSEELLSGEEGIATIWSELDEEVKKRNRFLSQYVKTHPEFAERFEFYHEVETVRSEELESSILDDETSTIDSEWQAVALFGFLEGMRHALFRFDGATDVNMDPDEY